MHRIEQGSIEEMADLLDGAEYRLYKLVVNATEEATVRDIALVLRDLAQMRWLLERRQPHDKRASSRIREPAVAVVIGAGGARDSVALHDISAGGALVECDHPPSAGQRITIELPGLGKDVVAAVRAVHGHMAHLSFAELTPDDLVPLLQYLERRYLRY